MTRCSILRFNRKDMSSPFSRRTLLQGATALPIFYGSRARAAGRRFAYAGTYSSPEGPEGSRGNGQGIYQFEVNAETGELKQLALVANDQNPAWLSLHPSGKYLYSANETNHYEGQSSGSAGAYSIDRESGELKLLNSISSQGTGPAHLSVHPSGKYVLVANYAGGTIAVLSIKDNGELGEATDVKKDQGTLGAKRATSAPPGSFAISGHDKPHGHMIQAEPGGKFVISTDLALDRVLVWSFDVQTGKLTENEKGSISLPSGDGPRHFAFHPKNPWVYVLGEESSTLVVCEYSREDGGLQVKQTLSTLPKGFTGTNFTSEVVVSSDGKFVYAANRLHDSIAWFTVGKDGTLTFAGEAWTRGDYPRSFTIDPSGNFLYSCNQRSDAIATFRIDRKSGEPKFTGQYTPVGTPGILVFI